MLAAAEGTARSLRADNEDLEPFLVALVVTCETFGSSTAAEAEVVDSVLTGVGVSRTIRLLIAVSSSVK